MDHLNDSTVLSAPDFLDPYAEFVMCTDASDFAVGGVLMQWQHPSGAVRAVDLGSEAPRLVAPAWRQPERAQLRRKVEAVRVEVPP